VDLPDMVQGGSPFSYSSKDSSLAMVAACLNPTSMTSGGHLSAGKTTRQEVIDYGGIKEPSMMTPRSSERIRAQANADATQLERAVALAQKRDDAYISGTCEKLKSRLSFFIFIS
jgi:hypothetical protein